MVRIKKRAQYFLAGLPPDAAPLEQLKAVARWTMEVQLAGEMPSLPSQNSTLRAALMGNRDYLARLVDVSARLGGFIERAQAVGSLNARLPPIVVLYTLFARACDPVMGFLKAGGQYSDAQIVDFVLASCFDGLASR
jgi:hypothetical protein